MVFINLWVRYGVYASVLNNHSAVKRELNLRKRDNGPDGSDATGQIRRLALPPPTFFFYDPATFLYSPSDEGTRS